MIVLSDTSPLNFLILIGHVDVLPVLFGQVVVPPGVGDELRSHGAPKKVRDWIALPPSWLVVRTPLHPDMSLELGVGEVEAISLAIELHADLLLIDDRLGRRAAESRGLSVTGTVNVLEAAAERDLIDLPAAINKLRQTNFHISDAILANALVADAERRRRRESQID